MPKVIKKKEQINATVSPWLKKRCIEIAQGPDFSSISDIVSQALSEFIAKYDDKKATETKKQEEKILEMFIYSLMQTKSGQEWLESMYKSDQRLTYEIETTGNYKSYKILQELSKIMCNQNEEGYSTEKKQ